MRTGIFTLLLVFVLTGCQFTETMVMNEDGSGRMTLRMDLSEMMAFGDEFVKDSNAVKQDTVIALKKLFEAQKDSIAQLPKAEQRRLKAMEDYKIRMITDPNENIFLMDVFTDFKDVSQANDLLKGLKQTDKVTSGDQMELKVEGDDGPSPETIGVRYSYKGGVFKRDAYVRDVQAHRSELDSLKKAESFMAGIRYKIRYTFPRKIESTSVEDATFSSDGKTMELERSFLDYYKNPDVLDIEVVLEK